MKLFSILAGLLLSGFLFAGEAQNDQKAKAILDDVSAKTKTYKTIVSTFIYTVEGKDKKVSDKQEGNIWVKGTKYKVEIAGQIIICDGKTIWTYLKESNEVQISTVETREGEDKITPSNIFTIYEKGFKYEFVKEEGKGAEVAQVIKLYPIDPKKKAYHTATITINKGKKQVQTMKINGKDGNTTTYILKKLTPNTEISDQFFTFDKSKYPGVEVIDLRE